MATEVGIRELRQNLSVYLRRVAEGERFVVTERGKPVAELGPRAEDQTAWERLLADPRWSPPTLRWEDIPPPYKDDNPDGQAAFRKLMEDRGDPLPPYEE